MRLGVSSRLLKLEARVYQTVTKHRSIIYVLVNTTDNDVIGIDYGTGRTIMRKSGEAYDALVSRARATFNPNGTRFFASAIYNPSTHEAVQAHTDACAAASRAATRKGSDALLERPSPVPAPIRNVWAEAEAMAAGKGWG